MSGRPMGPGGHPPLDDDGLRAMLEARAGRVGDAAAGEVMSALRAELRGPSAGQGLTVLPGPVSRRGGQSQLGWAAAGLVAVVLIALVGGRLGAGPSPVAGSPSVSMAPTGPAASLAGEEQRLLRQLALMRLELGLAAGDLDGQVVVVTGRLVAQGAARCLAGGSAPCPVEVAGLPGVQVQPSPSIDPALWPSIVERSAGRKMVMRVDGGVLRFLGFLANAADQPLTVAGFMAARPQPEEVTVVDGWLLAAGVASACPRASDASPGPVTGCEPIGLRVLSGTDPALGTLSEFVTIRLAADAPAGTGADLGPQPFRLGAQRYLVRDDGGPEIVGQLHAPMASVTIDSGTAASASGTPPTGPAGLDLDGLRAALSAGRLDGQTVIVTGQVVVQPWPCPNTMPIDCYGLQLRGLDGVEITHVGVAAADVAGHATDAPIAFGVAGGQLVLEGWLANAPGQPLQVAELLAPSNLPRQTQIAVVSGWLTGREAAACPDLRGMGSPVPCPDGDAWLTSRPPRADGSPVPGSAGALVEVAPSVADPGIVGVAGPFLVGRAGGDGITSAALRVAARLDPSRLVRVDGTVTSGEPSASPSAPLEAIAGRISVERFRLAVASGGLDGRLVLLQGRLVRQATPCPSAAADPCPRLSIAGLPDVPLTWTGPNEGADPIDDRAETLAVIPHDHALQLLGRVVGDPANPGVVYDWRERFGVLATPFDVHAIAGWLVVGGIHSCPALGPGATPCPGPGPQLTDRQPTAEGMMTGGLQLPAVSAPGAPGIDPARIVTRGPFLAWQGVGSTCSGLPDAAQAGCAGGRVALWEVVARYDPGSVVRVSLP